jgi:multicomponent K+:H+ antiporter subunit D
MTRAGIRTFWASMEGTVPRVLVMEMAPVMLLIALTLALTIKAGPAMRYMEETVRNLQSPTTYIEAVTGARRAGVVEASGPDGGGGI